MDTPFDELPQELIVSLFQLLDLASFLSLSVVSKHLNTLVSHSLGESFWTNLSVELFGFRPLLSPTKRDITKMDHCRSNILQGRFSFTRIPAPIDCLYPPRYSTTTLHNNLAHYAGKTAVVPTSSPLEELPPDNLYSYVHAGWKTMTNIVCLLRDRDSVHHAKLVDGSLVKIENIPQRDSVYLRGLYFIGDVVVFSSLRAHFDTSLPIGSDGSGLCFWPQTTKITAWKWKSVWVVQEGMCFVDQSQTRWKIVPWVKLSHLAPKYQLYWDVDYRICQTFVC